MEEIQFRAWDKTRAKFWYFSLDDSIAAIRRVLTLSEWNDLEKKQYTGLKDKNGKEIYQWDIVTGQYSHYDSCQDAYVKDEKMGGIVFFDGHKVNYFDLVDEKLHWGGQRFGDMEVIGNAYENPELLK